MKSYYDLLRHPEFIWESRAENFQIQGVVMDVDYYDERKFAEAAAAKAKVGKEIVDLTYRSRYVDDPDGQWQGYEDTDSARAWGVSEWSRRAFLGAYFDWAEINAILPSVGAFRLSRSDLDLLNTEVPAVIPLEVYNILNTFQDQGYAAQDAFTAALTAAGADPTPYPNILKYAEKTGLNRIDRSTVEETLEIAAQARDIQKQSDDANTGLNPLGLANEMVPFDIDPSRMIPGAYDHATHFEQVYERAVSALENARVTFDYANDLKSKIRQAANSTQQFTEQVDTQDRDYRNRLIEVLGSPYEGVIGTGQTYPAGYQGPDYFLYNYIDVNEVSDTSVPQPNSSFKAYFNPMNQQTGVDLKSAYSQFFATDLKAGSFTPVDQSSQLAVTFPQSASKYSFQAPASWGIRKSPGELQQVLIELVKAETDLQLALADYGGLLFDIKGSADLLKYKFNLNAGLIRIHDAYTNKVTTLNTHIQGLEKTYNTAMMVTETVGDLFDAAVEFIPKVVGLSNDATAPVRGAVLNGKAALNLVLRTVAFAADVAAGALENQKEILELNREIDIYKAEYKYEVQEMLKDLQDKMGNEIPTRLKVFKATEDMRQVSEKYRAVLAKALRLMEERKAFNTKVSAKTQTGRYTDMAFRLSVNDALSKYRSMFDVAARFAYMAAKAYDYETNLDSRDPASPKPILTDIIRERTIGQYKDGQYIVGQGGIGEALTRLKTNFSALKTQMGLNNPQSETSRMSLRYELFRITKDPATDADWHTELLTHRIDDLWTVPEFRKFCRPFVSEETGAQPGLVIPFTTNIISGKNFFGRPLGGFDHAYDSTNFATKVRSVGIWFEGYDNSLLSETPRIYLVPVGLDFMMVPNSTALDTREWTVLDQKIPVPLPVGESDLANPDWFPSLDSLNGPMVQIRKYSSARAYHDTGYFTVNEMNYDSRLIGRSVWNSRWMLIVPGATFNFDPDYGIDTFIDMVTDIKLMFETYSISGN